MDLVLALVATVVLLATVAFFWLPRKMKSTKECPEFPCDWNPVFGHALHFVQHKARVTNLVQTAMDNLKVDSLWASFGTDTRIFTRDPAVVKHFMKDNFEGYVKGPKFNSWVRDLLGDGIFGTDGKRWQIQRKTASQLFSNRRLKDHMTAVFVETSDELVNKLEDLTMTNGPHKPINIFNMYNRMTLDAFVRISFGVDLNCLKKAPDRIPFMDAFDRAQDLILTRSFNPFWRLQRWLKFGVEKQAALDHELIYKFIQTVINDRREGSADEPDLLSLFIRENTRYSPKPPTDEELRFTTLNFIIAGRDTTAQTLSWVTWMLDRRRDVLKKVLEEVDRETSDSWFKRVANMPYLHAVISETLRLYPIVLAPVKEAVRDDVLPNGFLCPKGVFIVGVSWCMGRNPKIWGDDALHFRPERWLEMKGNPPDHEFIAFNSGRRTCLGKNTAYLEMKITLVKFLERFEFRSSDSDLVVHNPNTTLPMRDGFHVYLSPRKASGEDAKNSE